MWYTLILNPKCHWIKWSVQFYAITFYYPNIYPECQLEEPITTTISRSQDSLSPRITQKEVYVNVLSIKGPAHSEPIPIRRHSKKQKEESILHILLAICVELYFRCQKGGKESFQKGCTSPQQLGWGQRVIFTYFLLASGFRGSLGKPELPVWVIFNQNRIQKQGVRAGPWATCFIMILSRAGPGSLCLSTWMRVPGREPGILRASQ